MRKVRTFKISYVFVVFIVQYTPSLIHAVDGLNHGLILIPVSGNFLFKMYDTSIGESF